MMSLRDNNEMGALRDGLRQQGSCFEYACASWVYDRYGNRTAQSGTHGSPPANTVSVSASTNQITGLGGYTFYYDANGNLTQDDLYKYKYDAENRLVELRNLSDTLLATYAYDGHSLRIAKVVSGWRTWYIYAGAKLISEFEDNASNTYSGGTTPGGEPQYYTELFQHADHLTTRFTTDNSGLTGNQQGHYPFGEVWYTSGQADPSVRRKFTSYMQDDEAATGKINYAYFRQHSSRLSRFLRPDPVFRKLGNPQALNRYAYVGGDPVGRTDHTGLDWDSPFWGADDTGGKMCGGVPCELPRYEGESIFTIMQEAINAGVTVTIDGVPYVPDSPTGRSGLGGLLGGGGGPGSDHAVAYMAFKLTSSGNHSCQYQACTPQPPDYALSACNTITLVRWKMPSFRCWDAIFMMVIAQRFTINVPVIGPISVDTCRQVPFTILITQDGEACR